MLMHRLGVGGTHRPPRKDLPRGPRLQLPRIGDRLTRNLKAGADQDRFTFGADDDARFRSDDPVGEHVPILAKTRMQQKAAGVVSDDCGRFKRARGETPNEVSRELTRSHNRWVLRTIRPRTRLPH
jgi:hypothetical protein